MRPGAGDRATDSVTAREFRRARRGAADARRVARAVLHQRRADPRLPGRPAFP